MFVVIAGIIGAGKTTLTTALAAELRGQAFFEPVETNPYLEDFYGDMERWGFTMQMYLLAQRFHQHQQLVWSATPAVQDRSIYEDVAFSRVLRASGHINERDFRTYESHFRTMIRFLVYPDVIFYLDVSPETALRRVQERARGCETGMTLDYLVRLRVEYERLMDELRNYTTVARLDWENPMSPADVAQIARSVSNATRPFSRTLQL